MEHELGSQSLANRCDRRFDSGLSLYATAGSSRASHFYRRVGGTFAIPLPSFRTRAKIGRRIAEANMRNRLARWAIVSIGAVSLATSAFAPSAPARAADSYSIELTGDQVGPAPADPDGEGTATISVRSEQGRICYTLSVEGIQPALAAHLHAAVAGRIGPIRLQFDPPIDGHSQGCIRADRDLLHALEERPQFFYIDVHTSEYPGPALRGQLGT